MKSINSLMNVMSIVTKTKHQLVFLIKTSIFFTEPKIYK